MDELDDNRPYVRHILPCEICDSNIDESERIICDVCNRFGCKECMKHCPDCGKNVCKECREK